MRDELKAANGYEGEDGAYKLNIENNLKKKQQMVVMGTDGIKEISLCFKRSLLSLCKTFR